MWVLFWRTIHKVLAGEGDKPTPTIMRSEFKPEQVTDLPIEVGEVTTGMGDGSDAQVT